MSRTVQLNNVDHRDLRVDTRSPTTRYFVEGITLDLPFSRNFVLVRHHLQAPPIHGSPDVPPSLTFYSFYMHLQDWAVYQDNPTQARPPFWPQSPTFRVKQTANDGRPGHPEEVGLNLRNADYQGKVIDLLPRGTEVVVSGRGYYRKLENRLGPTPLLDADGALAGAGRQALGPPLAGTAGPRPPLQRRAPLAGPRGVAPGLRLTSPQGSSAPSPAAWWPSTCTTPMASTAAWPGPWPGAAWRS